MNYNSRKLFQKRPKQKPVLSIREKKYHFAGHESFAFQWLESFAFLIVFTSLHCHRIDKRHQKATLTQKSSVKRTPSSLFMSILKSFTNIPGLSCQNTYLLPIHLFNSPDDHFTYYHLFSNPPILPLPSSVLANDFPFSSPRK